MQAVVEKKAIKPAQELKKFIAKRAYPVAKAATHMGPK